MERVTWPLPAPDPEQPACRRRGAAGRARLLAVSRPNRPRPWLRWPHRGQQAFGENYVQEALAKMQALQHLALEWHLIGHLQSNKADAVATHFDWVQSVDRPKLVTALARHRPAARGPLNVLIRSTSTMNPASTAVHRKTWMHWLRQLPPSLPCACAG